MRRKRRCWNSPPSRGGVARQPKAGAPGGPVRTERFAERTTPSAQPARWLSAQTPLLATERCPHRPTPANTTPTAPPRLASCFTSSTIPYLRSSAFEMYIVDEAVQLTEPLTLGLILRARRFVLIGDDRQLPPVVRVRELGQSMFERLKRDTENLTLLETQYRMHPGIMELSNRLFYEGRLRSGIAVQERAAPDDAPVVFIPVKSERDGRSNPDEARVVVDLVESFTRDRVVDPESIGVVSPFRAQVVLLRQMLGGSRVTIDTVERFQGGERDIMILSFVRSRGTGFVFDG